MLMLLVPSSEIGALGFMPCDPGLNDDWGGLTPDCEHLDICHHMHTCKWEGRLQLLISCHAGIVEQ